MLEWEMRAANFHLLKQGNGSWVKPLHKVLSFLSPNTRMQLIKDYKSLWIYFKKFSVTTTINTSGVPD